MTTEPVGTGPGQAPPADSQKPSAELFPTLTLPGQSDPKFPKAAFQPGKTAIAIAGIGELDMLDLREVKPGHLIVIRSTRSPDFLDAAAIRDIAKRLPTDSLILQMTPGTEIGMLDEGMMQQMGWVKVEKMVQAVMDETKEFCGHILATVLPTVRGGYNPARIMKVLDLAEWPPKVSKRGAKK